MVLLIDHLEDWQAKLCIKDKLVFVLNYELCQELQHNQYEHIYDSIQDL
jgi:hypothetical protein